MKSAATRAVEIVAAVAVLLSVGPAAAAADSPKRQIAALKARIAAIRKAIQWSRDYDAVDNLNSVYNFYVDKNRWDQAVDLYARDGSMELAQRGVYTGQDRIRAFYHETLGTEGPSPNRLGDHLQVQNVIHIDPDGKTAHIRSRSVQMMGNAGGRASWGGGVYENTAVKEGGQWKMKAFHVFNTFTIDYSGGLTKETSSSLPGPNPRFPPDQPPSLVFQDFPNVYHAKAYDYDQRVQGEPRVRYDPTGGQTALIYAAREGCVDCAKALVEGGAKLDDRDPDGVTAMITAALNAHFDFAAYLVKAGADVNRWDWWGRTALWATVDYSTLPRGGRSDRPPRGRVL